MAKNKNLLPEGGLWERGVSPPELYRQRRRYSISMGSTMTNVPICPLFRNLMRPEILAKRVSSLPRPTLSPGFTRVPRCRTMMVPPGTICPPNALNPNRCAFESRPFREVPCPFLCAIRISFRWPVASYQQNHVETGDSPVLPYFFFLFFEADFLAAFLGAAFFFAEPLVVSASASCSSAG